MGRELHVHSVQSRAERIRTMVEVIAIVAAGLWALYTFVYEQRIKPLSEAPEFSVVTTVEQGPTTNGVAFLTVHKRLDNTGNVGIDIAAETLSVFLVGVPAKTYPVIAVTRKDYIGKVPISPKFSVRIEKTQLGAYDLVSPQHDGEYDTETEYPIHP